MAKVKLKKCDYCKDAERYGDKWSCPKCQGRGKVPAPYQGK